MVNKVCYMGFHSVRMRSFTGWLVLLHILPCFWGKGLDLESVKIYLNKLNGGSSKQSEENLAIAKETLGSILRENSANKCERNYAEEREASVI